ncbi:MAG: response regulator [Bacteroidetes bacterium]|nr:response regulator [Bacteroidota bacterium]
MNYLQKILIVDDKEENLFALRKLLEEVDAEVILAGSGDKALKHILNQRFALAILDVQMPEMDGYELAELIRNAEETRHLSIIFLSAVYSDDYHIFKGYSSGAVDFIVKPFNPMVFVNKVKVFLDLDRQRSELQEYKERLEELVGIRTQELLKTNKNLQKAKERAEESDRLKSAFLANLSHEIRTPLNAVTGFSEILRQRKVNADEQNRFLDLLHSNANRLLNIITDIIAISKLEVNLEKAAFSRFSLDAVMEEVFSVMFLEKSKKTGIDLIYERHKDETVISSDKGKLSQILINIIKNAIKFTEQGYVRYGYKIYSDHIQFYVTDTGCGIETDKQTVIFERFRQADESVAVKYGGNGLGLAISKGYVELLNGKIWLESVPGKGSTFYFTIPYVPYSNEKTDEQ